MLVLTEETLRLSARVEELLVAHNPRGMARLRPQLVPGYCARAAKQLWDFRDRTILIGTGFPVSNTFETDGPAGAMALYDALQCLGANVWIAGPPSLAAVLAPTHQVLALHAAHAREQQRHCEESLGRIKPDLIIAIEVPGAAADGHYYNIRGIDISAQCGNFESFIKTQGCPTIGIGDGGNEAGMGNISAIAADLPIKQAVGRCNELVIADVSNWGAYALVGFLGHWAKQSFLQDLRQRPILEWLSEHGAVDGVTHQRTATEDGLSLGSGNLVIDALVKVFNTEKDTQ
ncbi:MAG: DUF4392 domain-containing protein [Halieaceae bacterium]|nr:DUF4392 domain-containing protein [Halieaceae bacterium]